MADGISILVLAHNKSGGVRDIHFLKVRSGFSLQESEYLTVP
jgi:hypothetical protein